MAKYVRFPKSYLLHKFCFKNNSKYMRSPKTRALLDKFYMNFIPYSCYAHKVLNCKKGCFFMWIFGLVWYPWDHLSAPPINHKLGRSDWWQRRTWVKYNISYKVLNVRFIKMHLRVYDDICDLLQHKVPVDLCYMFGINTIQAWIAASSIQVVLEYIRYLF